MTALPAQRTFFRGSDGYEAARRKTVWNSILPQRFPDVIVQASDTADVVATIRYARAHGHRVGIRSGGHSWAASHLRDGGLLLDVSRLAGLGWRAKTPLKEGIARAYAQAPFRQPVA